MELGPMILQRFRGQLIATTFIEDTKKAMLLSFS
jgi:hypothetical protein